MSVLFFITYITYMKNKKNIYTYTVHLKKGVQVLQPYATRLRGVFKWCSRRCYYPMKYKNWPDSESLSPPMSEIVPMVQRVEFAAMQEIRNTGTEKLEACMPDPRYTECPEDSFDWMILFARARRIDAELAALLYYLRGGGCRLCEDPKWGARILYEGPWTDEELSVAKAELRKHSADMQYLLAELAWPGGVKPKDDAKTQNQDRHQP